jgi:hypothetical protein
MGKLVMYDSPEAAQIKTVTGWVSRDGKFYGDWEYGARYQGSTHKMCECGRSYPTKGYCLHCSNRKSRERFDKMPEKEWDGETPLVIFNDDTYFLDEDELISYCEDNDVAREALDLCICEPNYARKIDLQDIFDADILPENGSDDLEYLAGPEVLQALDKLNNAISKLPPLSWSQGKYKVQP